MTNFASFAVYGILFGLCFGLTIGVEWSNVAELVETDILSDAITFIQVCFASRKLFQFISSKHRLEHFLLPISVAGFLTRLETTHTFSTLPADYFFLVHFKQNKQTAVLDAMCFWSTECSGAACAGIVAIRRRCSLGEMYEEEVLPSKGPSLLVTPAEVSLFD